MSAAVRSSIPGRALLDGCDAAGDRLRAVLDEARREGRMPLAVADEHALRTIAAARDHTREKEC